MSLPLLGLLVTALTLVAVSTVTRFVHLDDFASAILAAMLLWIVPMLTAWLVSWSGYEPHGTASAMMAALVTQLLALGVVALFLQGVTFNGLFGFLMTALILTAIDWLLPIVLAYVIAALPRPAS